MLQRFFVDMAYKMELIAYYNYLHPFHVFNVCIIIHIGQGKFGPRAAVLQSLVPTLKKTLLPIAL